jgi:hypothetical protein
MTTRIMGDSTSLLAIPLSVAIAAVYDDGHLGVETAAQLEARFPHVKYGHVFIDVTGANPKAQVRDWETGDKSSSLEQWVTAHNKASGRKDAVIYCNRSTIPEVRQLTGTQILGADYFLWIATLDGTVATGPGIIGCQVKGAGLTGGDWDMSLVFDGALWLPVTPKPKPVLVSKERAEAAVSAAVASLATLAVYVTEG